jgi:hypothetical protein
MQRQYYSSPKNLLEMCFTHDLPYIQLHPLLDSQKRIPQRLISLYSRVFSQPPEQILAATAKKSRQNGRKAS